MTSFNMLGHGKVQQRQQQPQSKLQTPPGTMFPCASGVTMPQFGAEESEPSKGAPRSMVGRLTLRPLPVDDTPVDRRYVKKISTEMNFEEDVVKERCFFMLPYDSKYLAEALDYTTIVAPRPRKPVGRHNGHGATLRHLPCVLKTTKPSSSLKPMKKKMARKALAMSFAARQGEEISSCNSPSSSVCLTGADKEEGGAEGQMPSNTFLTEVQPQGAAATAAAKPGSPETLENLQAKLKALKDAAAQEEEEQKRPKSARMLAEKNQKDWDTFLMSRLSQRTATWIVHECMDPNKQKEELQKTLEEWYGQPPHNVDLIEEDGSESDTDFPLQGKDKKVKPKKKWKKAEESLLERVYHLDHPQAEANDPYSDDNKAPFYRQPAGIRRQKKHNEKEEAGAINATAHRIKVKSTKLPKPSSLRDFMPKGVGKTLYETQNQYEQELLTGVKQMHPAKGDGSILVMASDHKYLKVLRREYPDAPETWFPATDQEKEQKKQDAQQQPIKREHGAKRWKSLPQPYDDTFASQMMVPPGFTPKFKEQGDPSGKRRVKQNTTLTQILKDWRSKWNLSGQFADATFDDIIKDMADIQPHVRLKAIATVGKAAEYKPPSDPGIQIGSQNIDSDPLSEIPEKVFIALDCLLGDSNDQVCRAAAITLFALEQPTKKAEDILRKALMSEAASERWAAAQCLAHFGVCDSHVVDEIIKQILDSEDAIKHEQGICLLAKISNSTTLVHCMVAEQLNSSSWRHRVIACKILPTLYGSINKDVTHKLTELMWHDWHMEVRHAAAQCLGKTCHGRDVHDDIRRCIMYGSERTKLAAISRLGQLGIMTAKLLPAFLECFEDQYVSIRSECCITSGNLQIKEERVIEKLVHLATFDPIWKVKALAIQALGKIGVVSEGVKECLLWAMRYEEKEGVRAEACHSLMTLDLMDHEVIQVLQERLLVEGSQVVREEMVEALHLVGLNATEDMDMVAQIKGEVRKLCKQNIIAAQIVLNEAADMRQEHLETMIFMTQEEQREKEEERQESARKRLREITSASASGSTHQMDLAPPGGQQQQQEESSAPASQTTTPDPYSREGTMFTPSADKELQAILSRDDGDPSVACASRDSSGKSHTAASEGAETSGTYSSPVSSCMSKRSLPNDYVEEADRQVAASSATPTREAKEYPIALTPARSRQGLTPSASVIEDLGYRSQVSGGRRTVMSRETLRERQNFDSHTSANYAGLSERYSSMNSQLARMDMGISVASTSNFLTVPGESSAPAAPTSTALNTTTADITTTTTNNNDNNTTTSEPGQSQEAGADNTVASEGTSVIFSLREEDTTTDAGSGIVVREGEGEMEKDDGQIVVSLEVPVSDQPGEDESYDRNDNHPRRSSPLSLEYTSAEDDAGGGTTTSYLDDSGGENALPAPSNYGGSEAYPPGQASEYATSEGYDDDDQSTLDE